MKKYLLSVVANRILLPLGVTLLLVGCGATEVLKNVDDTYTVSAQYGSLNGSWDRASKEANERALVYCDGKGQKLQIIKERREGVWGVSPQRAEVKFRCTNSVASQNTKPLTASVEDQLRELKALFAKGLLTQAQYDARVAKVLAEK